jgi:3-oxoacyl-[acyl-carrier-protein] synthase II
VITGLGLSTPVGTGVEKTWDGLVAGKSGIDVIHGYDVRGLETQLGGEVPDFAPETLVPNKRVLRKLTRGDQFALGGSFLAATDAGLEVAENESERAGLFVGSNKEVSELRHLLEPTVAARNPDGTVDFQRFGESANTTAYPLFYVEGLQAAALFYVSEAFGLRGANTYFAGTAEASATAIGRAFRAIKRGEADVVITGGFDDATSWWSMTKLDSLDGYLTKRNDLGASACRPYDRDRDGTVVGEGCALMVLETLDAAQARGARIYAEVTGLGSGNDASPPLVPRPDGRGLRVALDRALDEAGLEPGQVDYVATHGSGAPSCDASEARAIGATFGTNGNRVVASSVKGATGHLVAAAGALNVAVAALAIYHRTVPPTLNLEHVDPECDTADWVPGEARELEVENAIALARGFAGQSVALALRAVR